MKILKADQIREADAFTIEHEPISSIDLMERAASRCTEWIKRNILPPGGKADVHVVCGIGNNGGDGLVIGRQLTEEGYSVQVHVLNFSDKHSDDFEKNLERLKHTEAEVVIHKQGSDVAALPKNSIVVDAIFGTGLGRPVKGWIGKWVDHMNEQSVALISVDAPSGLFSEDNRTNDGSIIRADHTLTFQVPKLAFFHPSNYQYVGAWHVLDIGLHPEKLRTLETAYWYASSDLVRGIPVHREKFTHKGSYGHALLVGGSKGMMGAMVLAAKSCLRSGAGLTTLHVPKCGLEIVQSQVPEAMCETDDGDLHVLTNLQIQGYNAIGIGPGLGQEENTAQTIKNFIHDSNVAKVFDADALNILAENKTWLSFLKGPTVITPHPGEFRRLVGVWESDEEKLERQIEFANKYNCVVVLKGAHTSIAFPDGQVFFNSTGNPGMATGGSGDTLTGLITGLLAQGYSPGKASILGVYLHGLAGDLSIDNSQSEASLTPSDLIDHLGEAWKSLGVR